MFTVLIAEKEHIDAVQQENKLFFEPFLANKELAFCQWNPAGQSLVEAVPGLLDAVGRRKEWRAVIISPRDGEFYKTRNPFDVVDPAAFNALQPPNRQLAEGESRDHWEADWKTYCDKVFAEKELLCKQAMEHPLQKLTTWLSFTPEEYILKDVQEKQDVHDWALEWVSKEQLGANVRKPNEYLELLERAQYKRELRMKEELRRSFVSDGYLNVVHPKDVYCIAIRSTEESFFDPDDYWRDRGDNNYSTFADRNMYLDKLRFMVFDLLPENHRNFRTDYIRFLATMLIFVSNPVPSGSVMQTRHLYRLEVESDDTPLCTLVTSYDRKLAATADAVENEIEQIRGEIPGEMTDKAAEALFCTPQDVTVVLDESCDPEKVLADTDYGLFFDYPADEYYKWNSNVSQSKEALSWIVKQQSRSIRKSVGQANLSSEVFDVNANRLTPFQMDDVKDYTDAAEDEMVASIPADLSDISRYTERLDEQSEKVKQVLAQRMTIKTTLALSAICLGLLLVCFLPFLFNNNATTKTVMTSVLLTLGMLAVLAVIMIVALFVMRGQVKTVVRGYNEVVRGILNDIQSSLQNFSKYLSASVNVRRGHAVQNFTKRNLDEYTRGIRIRRKHQEDIRKKRAFLKEDYGDYFGDRSFVDETMSRPYEYDFDLKKEYEYPAPFLAGDCRQIEFLSSGNLVTVPSSYIRSVAVRMEGIYE